VVQHRSILDAGADDRWALYPFSLNRAPKSRRKAASRRRPRCVNQTLSLSFADSCQR
jgi:hypothetical protein